MNQKGLLVALALSLVVVGGCGGGGGGGGGSAPPPIPTVSLTSSAADSAVNGSVTLTWSSTNATGCVAAGAWSGNLAASGSQSVTVAQNSTYSIACSGGGGSANASVSVIAWNAPTVTLAADSTAILANNTVTLTWSSQNAKSCTGGGGLSSAIANSGSQVTAALAATTTFSISCSNPVFAAVNAAVTVTVSPTLALAVTVQYQAPGAPVVNAAATHYVPDWAHPTLSAVPFVYVELDSPTGQTIQSTYADANGVAQFSGLDPTVSYTPKILSKIRNAALGVDFEVVNNTAPIDTSQGTFRARYAPYSTTFAAYVPGPRLASQAATVSCPDGWDTASAKLVDANRVAGPYELVAFATFEAQTISAAVGPSAPLWRPLTILWSVRNKGSLSAPPNNYDQGVTINDGFYGSGHKSIDTSGADTGAAVAEDFIYLGGDQTVEAQDIYPTVMTHEMGHFSQRQFSTLIQPAGGHGYSDYSDPLLAWIEGSASGISALVMNTPKQFRLGQVSGEVVVAIIDISNNTVNGNPQPWPVGWYQETTTTGLMWAVHDPAGGMGLSAATTLAPMFSSTWRQGPWLNTVWAYLFLLKQANATIAAAIDNWSSAHGIVSVGNDVWGSLETNVGNRTAQDALPPYTSVSIGQSVQVCSVGAPLNYNKEGNRRMLRLQGDGASHTLTVQGPAGTVPVIGSTFTPGSTQVAVAATVAAQGAIARIGDCAVVLGQFTSVTAACSEIAVPPAEQCWMVSWQ